MPTFDPNDPRDKIRYNRFLERRARLDNISRYLFGRNAETMIAVAFIFAGALIMGIGTMAAVRDGEISYLGGALAFAMVIGGIGVAMLPRS